jgi:hypothetical protein
MLDGVSEKSSGLGYRPGPFCVFEFFIRIHSVCFFAQECAGVRILLWTQKPPDTNGVLSFGRRSRRATRRLERVNQNNAASSGDLAAVSTNSDR